jgi:hypothetical protein
VCRGIEELEAKVTMNEEEDQEDGRVRENCGKPRHIAHCNELQG